MLKRLRSECGKFTLERVGDDVCGHRLLDALGNVLCTTTFWSNRTDEKRVRFETGSGGVRATFSYERYPRWFYRLWVECWDLDCATLTALAEKCGATVLVCFKPSMNVWNHLGVRATPAVVKKLKAELRRRKIGFETRRRPGHFGIECPTSAREKSPC